MDSAYRIVLPNFAVEVAMHDLDEHDDCRGPSAPPLGTLRVHIPRFCFDYLKNLDAKHMLLQADACVVDIEQEPVLSERGPGLRGPSVRALNWQGLRFTAGGTAHPTWER